MITLKRVDLKRKSATSNKRVRQKVYRIFYRMRLRRPLQFDFCRMTIEELIGMMDKIINDDRRDPTTYKPIVAIVHTKDLVDFKTIDSFLSYLGEKNIEIATFQDAYKMISNEKQ